MFSHAISEFEQVKANFPLSYPLSSNVTNVVIIQSYLNYTLFIGFNIKCIHDD